MSPFFVQGTIWNPPPYLWSKLSIKKQYQASWGKKKWMWRILPHTHTHTCLAVGVFLFYMAYVGAKILREDKGHSREHYDIYRLEGFWAVWFVAVIRSVGNRGGRDPCLSHSICRQTAIQPLAFRRVVVWFRFGFPCKSRWIVVTSIKWLIICEADRWKELVEILSYMIHVCDLTWIRAKRRKKNIIIYSD